MTVNEIKQAVESDKRVHWVHTGYEVIKDSKDQWLIKCEGNDHCIGLTHRDGVTLNGEPDEFFIGD